MSENVQVDNVNSKGARPKKPDANAPPDWHKDGSGDYVWAPANGAIACVWPVKGGNGWRAMFWGDGSVRELPEKFKTVEAAITAVQTFNQKNRN